MNYRRFIFTFASLVIGSTNVHAGDDSIQLRGEVYVTAAGGQTKGINDSINVPITAYLVRYRIVIKNISKTLIAVPTGGFQELSEGGSDYTKLRLQWDFAYEEDDTPLMVSESELKIVRLKPGETTVVSYVEVVDDIHRLTKVLVTYEVAEKFGARYGLWTGVCAPTVEVRGAAIASIREHRSEPAERGKSKGSSNL